MFDNVRSHKTEDVTVGWNSDISLSATLAAQYVSEKSGLWMYRWR